MPEPKTIAAIRKRIRIITGSISKYRPNAPHTPNSFLSLDFLRSFAIVRNFFGLGRYKYNSFVIICYVFPSFIRG